MFSICQTFSKDQKGVTEENDVLRECLSREDITHLTLVEDNYIKLMDDDDGFIDRLQAYCSHFALRNEIGQYWLAVTRRVPPRHLVISGDWEDFPPLVYHIRSLSR